MFPVLVSLGPLRLYSFGTLLILGLVLSWALVRYLMFFYKLHPSKFYPGLLWGIVGGLIFARLGYIFTYTERLRGSLWSILFSQQWWTEFALWVGILSGILIMVIYWLKHNEPVFLWLDVISVAVQPLIFFTSLGLFLSPVGLTAEALGRPTALPWGVLVDAVDLPFANVPVHPLILYIVFISGIAFVGAWLFRTWARTYVGRLFVIVMALYATLWFFLGVVRWYSPHPFFGLDIYWLNAILYLVLSILCLIYILHKHRVTQKLKRSKVGTL